MKIITFGPPSPIKQMVPQQRKLDYHKKNSSYDPQIFPILCISKYTFSESDSKLSEGLRSFT